MPKCNQKAVWAVDTMDAVEVSLLSGKFLAFGYRLEGVGVEAEGR